MRLPIKTPRYHQLQTGFQHWLKTLGYSKSIVHDLPYYLQEFLHYLEQTNTKTNWTAAPIASYINHLKTRRKVKRPGSLSDHSINNQIHMLSKFSEYLFKVHGQTLPVSLQPLSVAQHHREVISKKDITTLYNNTSADPLGSRDRAMLAIYYGCGLRRSEGERLNIENVSLEGEILLIRESKNGKSRVVPLSPGVKQHLSEYMSYGREELLTNPDESAFFLNRKGNRIKGAQLCVRLKQLLKTSGLNDIYPEAGLHTLRHSIATHLMEGGMLIEDVGRFLGHQSLESTQVYTHLCHH